MQYCYQSFLILIFLSSCGSGSSDNSISPEQQINQFTQQVNILNSENNLVKEVKSELGDLYILFEDASSASIKSNLVSFEYIEWNLKLKFSDNTSIDLMAIGSSFTVNTIDNELTNVPLSKEIEVLVPYNGKIIWTANGRNGRSTDISNELIASKGTFKTFIHGLYVDGFTEVTIQYTNIEGYIRATKSINIYPLELTQGPISINVESMGDSTSQRLFLFSHRAGNGPTVIDHYGDIRYYLDESAGGGYGLKQTSRGSLIWALGNTIWEVKLNGEIIWNHQIPDKYGDGDGGIHHDILYMGEDKFLLTVSNTELSTSQDIIILYDASTSSVLKEWDLNDSVPKTDYFIGSDGRAQTFNDWFHVNAIEYKEEDNSILVSGQRSGVVNLSWDNELIWFLTDKERFQNESLELTNKILFNQYDEIIAWGQHNIRFDDNNKVYYLFDNGLGRNYENTNKYSRGVKFKINDADLSYQIIETYGEDYVEYHSPIISGIDFNDNGSVLTLFGSIGYQLDYTNNKDWLGGVWKDPQPDYGAALLEHNSDGDLIFNATFSLKRGSGLDPGIYRAGYVDLSK